MKIHRENLSSDKKKGHLYFYFLEISLRNSENFFPLKIGGLVYVK